jgi:hypothetical protein
MELSRRPDFPRQEDEAILEIESTSIYDNIECR